MGVVGGNKIIEIAKFIRGKMILFLVIEFILLVLWAIFELASEET
jgi:hypothetical protein